MRGFFLMKRADRFFLATALLWLTVLQGVAGGESAPQDPRPPLLPAPKTRRDGLLPNTSVDPSEEGAGARPPPATVESRPGGSHPPRRAGGISGALEKSFQISASALVFAVFCGWGVVLPFWQPQKLQIRGKVWEWLSIYANGLACLASALALAALILWSYDQGFPAIFIFPTILLLHIMLVTGLVVVTILFHLDILHQVTDGAVQRMLDLTTPGGAILVAVISSLLIKHISQLQEEEHAEPIDVTAVVAAAAGMCIFPAAGILASHYMDMQRRAEAERISRREKWKKDIQQGKISLP